MVRIYNILIALCLVLICTSSSVHARRRSRIDLPIKDSADAPLEDNIAMASSSTSTSDKLPTQSDQTALPPSTTIEVDTINENNDNGSSESTSSEELQDCDNIDNISFELVTGQVFNISL